jgi:hypothetical protein
MKDTFATMGELSSAAKAAGVRFVGLRIDGDVRVEQLAQFPGR